MQQARFPGRRAGSSCRQIGRQCDLLPKAVHELSARDFAVGHRPVVIDVRHVIGVLVPDGSRGLPAIFGVFEYEHPLRWFPWLETELRLCFTVRHRPVRGDDDLGVAVTVDVTHDRILERGRARHRGGKADGSGVTVERTEPAFITRKDLGRAVAVEVKRRGAAHTRRDIADGASPTNARRGTGCGTRLRALEIEERECVVSRYPNFGYAIRIDVDDDRRPPSLR